MTLPPLPRRYCYAEDGEECFKYDDVVAYGEACAAAERERCARVAEQQAECNGLAADNGTRHLAAGVSDHWRDECMRLRAGMGALIRERRGAESIREELQALLYRGPNVNSTAPSAA